MEMVKKLIIATILMSCLVPMTGVHAANEDAAEEVKEAAAVEHGLGEALLKAAQNGDEQDIQELLAQGAPVDYKNEQGQTSLMLAASEGFVNIINILLDAKAQVDVADAQGETALLYAVCQYKPDAVEALLCNQAVVASIDMCDKKGDSALIRAAKWRNAAICDILLRKGANVNIEDQMNVTALMWASLKGYVAVVKVLLNNVSVDINTQNVRGDTVLIYAARGGFIEVVELLLEKNADVSIQSKAGYTALQWAVKGGFMQVIQALVDGGAGVELCDNDRNTCVFEKAVHCGQVDIFKFLYEYAVNNGVDVTVLSDKMYELLDTAVAAYKKNTDVAAYKKDTDMVIFLLYMNPVFAGSDIAISILRRAVAWEQAVMVRLLILAGVPHDVLEEGGRMTAWARASKRMQNVIEEALEEREYSSVGCAAAVATGSDEEVGVLWGQMPADVREIAAEYAVAPGCAAVVATGSDEEVGALWGQMPADVRGIVAEYAVAPFSLEGRAIRAREARREIEEAQLLELANAEDDETKEAAGTDARAVAFDGKRKE